MEYNRHVFPSSLVGSVSQMVIMVLTDTRLTCKDSTSFDALRPLVKHVYHITPLLSEERQLWHANIALQLEDSQVHILNGTRENRSGSG